MYLKSLLLQQFKNKGSYWYFLREEENVSCWGKIPPGLMACHTNFLRFSTNDARAAYSAQAKIVVLTSPIRK
jgi:hypothetical protein